MKASEFKKFKRYITYMGVDDYLLSAGYLWLRMTDKQVEEIASILSINHDIKMGIECGKDKNYIQLPNGLKLFLLAHNVMMKYREKYMDDRRKGVFV